MTAEEATFTEDIYSIPPPTTIAIGKSWKEVGEDEVELLSKILHSVRLGLDGARIVEMKSLDLSAWKEKPALLVGFGVPAPGVPTYEVVDTPHTKLVLADGLSTLLHDDPLKKKLWISLKQ